MKMKKRDFKYIEEIKKLENGSKILIFNPLTGGACEKELSKKFEVVSVKLKSGNVQWGLKNGNFEKVKLIITETNESLEFPDVPQEFTISQKAF
jgi:hypothetical protein